MSARVCLGAIVGASGVRGRVRVKTFTARPEAIAEYGPLEDEEGRREFRISVERVSRGVVIARVDGVDDRDGAERLRGTRLHLDRSKLPAPEEEEYYHADLVGLAVLDRAGNRVGVVRALHDFGAGDLLEFLPDDGGTPRVVPFTREAVPRIDLAGGAVTVDPPEGL